MKKLLSIALVALSFVQLGHAADTAQDIGAAAAAAALQQGGGMSAEFLNKGLAEFQETTGVQASAGGSPAGGGAGTASISVNKRVELNCAGLNTSKNFSAGPISFIVNSCSSGNPQSPTADILVCSEAVNSGVCDSKQAYKSSVTLQGWTPKAINGGSIAFESCNGPKSTCTVIVTGSYSVGGSQASLASSAGSIAAGSNYLNDLRTSVIESGAYNSEATSVRATVKEGTANISSSENKNCGAARTCLQYASAVNTYARTCTRQLPVTERIQNLRYSATKTCEITATVTTTPGASSTTSASGSTPARVTTVTNSCIPEGSGNPLSGMTLVGSKITSVDTQSSATEDVETTTSVEYWVNTRNPDLTNQTFKPLPLRPGGVCDTNAASPTRSSMCNSGWFGRTLSDAECTATDEGTGGIPGTEASKYFGIPYSQKAGCGFCLDTTISESCQGDASAGEPGVSAPDSCEGLEESLATSGDTCSLQSVSVITNIGSIATTQSETYSCTHKSPSQCVSWSEPKSVCISDGVSQGLETLKSGPAKIDGSFNNALVAAALMDGTARGLEGGQDPTIPKLFNGDSLRCRSPVGGLGQILHQECCRSDLNRPSKGDIIQGGCDMEEVKLSAARRSSYTHQIPGDYCSREVKTWFFSFCLETTRKYCVFPGILPKLIQEQGREQLANITASGSNASVQRTAMSFALYDDTKEGSWTPVSSVNGVRIAAYKWPSFCKNQEDANKELLNNPNAKDCPSSVSAWFAACDLAVGCNALPDQPSAGGFNWNLVSVNPLTSTTTAISKFAVVRGACDTSSQNCEYEVSAWPVGQGGKAVVTRDLSWPLFQSGTVNNVLAGSPTAAQYQMNNMGDLMFKGYSDTGSSAGGLPSTVKLDFSSDGGQTWRTLALPTKMPSVNGVEQEYSVPLSDVKLAGSCDVVKNICNYRATGTVTVYAKSWGNVHSPDCSGFTPGQLAVLDFGKMDLSEWLNSVMDKMASKNPADLAGQAATQFANFNAQFNEGNGTVSSSSPSGANFARVTPAEGFGPFTATLSVSGYWPETTGDPARDQDLVNRVQRVEVQWGNCSVSESLSPVSASLGVGFQGRMTYQAPDSYPCLFTGGNTVHKITITAHTADGNTYERSVSVENAWSKYPGADSNNSNVSTTSTRAATSPSVPLPPTAATP
jgi:hypothetical protein